MRTGRPTKLDNERAGIIVAAIRRGAPLESTAAQGKISRRTLYEWLRRGGRAREVAESTGDPIPSSERPFADFYVEVMAAQADWETGRLDKIDAAASSPQHWTAAAWLLERRMPEKYALKSRVDHQHELRIEIGHSRPEEIDWTEAEPEDPGRALPSPRENGNALAARSDSGRQSDDPRRPVIAGLLRDVFTPPEAEALLAQVMQAEPRRIEAIYTLAWDYKHDREHFPLNWMAPLLRHELEKL